MSSTDGSSPELGEIKEDGKNETLTTNPFSFPESFREVYDIQDATVPAQISSGGKKVGKSIRIGAENAMHEYVEGFIGDPAPAPTPSAKALLRIKTAALKARVLKQAAVKGNRTVDGADFMMAFQGSKTRSDGVEKNSVTVKCFFSPQDAFVVETLFEILERESKLLRHEQVEYFFEVRLLRPDCVAASFMRRKPKAAGCLNPSTSPPPPSVRWILGRTGLSSGLQSRTASSRMLMAP